jgi:hypothetical protein
VSRVREGDEIPKGAEPRIDRIEIRDVVAIVAVRGRIEGKKPHAGRAERLDMVEAIGQTAEIADAVAVRVHEGLDVDAIDDGVLVPEIEHLRPV